MNQRTVLGILLVFLVAMFTQCTVQKRLYRRGWYVGFHHRHVPGTSETGAEKQALIALQVRSNEAAAASFPAEKQEPVLLIDTVPEETTQTPEILVKAAESGSEGFSDKTFILLNKQKNTVKDQKRPYDQNDKTIKVTLLLVLLLLFSCLIILMLVGLSTSTSIISSIMINLLLLVTIPIAVGLLIATLVVTFSKTKQQLAEEKRLKAEEEEQLEGMTPEQRKEYEAANNTKREPNEKRSNVVAAFIAAAIVLLAIFVLSDK